jgi:beta-N-acetylhexosaminidase
VVEKPLEALRAVELAPFVHACRARIESLMTAHVLFRSLDRDYPATLSHRVITGILRQELGYDGVVFGDDMEMKAVTDNYSREEALLRGIRAGNDVFMYCHDQSNALGALEFIIREVEKEPSLRARVEKSYSRIKSLKSRYLRNFTGVAEHELAPTLAQLEHQLIVDEIQGSL